MNGYRFDCHCNYRHFLLLKSEDGEVDEDENPSTKKVKEAAKKAKEAALNSLGGLRAELIFVHRQPYQTCAKQNNQLVPGGNKWYGRIMEVVAFQVVARHTHPVHLVEKQKKSEEEEGEEDKKMPAKKTPTKDKKKPAPKKKNGKKRKLSDDEDDEEEEDKKEEGDAFGRGIGVGYRGVFTLRGAIEHTFCPIRDPYSYRTKTKKQQGQVTQSLAIGKRTTRSSAKNKKTSQPAKGNGGGKGSARGKGVGEKKRTSQPAKGNGSGKASTEDKLHPYKPRDDNENTNDCLRQLMYSRAASALRLPYPAIDFDDKDGMEKKKLIALCSGTITLLTGMSGKTNGYYEKQYMMEDAIRHLIVVDPKDTRSTRRFYENDHKENARSNDVLFTVINLFHLGEFPIGNKDPMSNDVMGDDNKMVEEHRFGLLLGSNSSYLFKEKQMNMPKPFSKKAVWKMQGMEMSGYVRVLQKQEGGDFANHFKRPADRCGDAKKIFKRTKKMHLEEIWVAHHHGQYHERDGNVWRKISEPGLILRVVGKEAAVPSQNTDGKRWFHSCNVRACETSNHANLLEGLNRWVLTEIKCSLLQLEDPNGEVTDWGRQITTKNGNHRISVHMHKNGDGADVPVQLEVGMDWGTKAEVIEMFGMNAGGSTRKYVSSEMCDAFAALLDKLDEEAMATFRGDGREELGPLESYMRAEITEAMFDVRTSRTTANNKRIVGYEEYKHLSCGPDWLDTMEERGYKVYVFLQPFGYESRALSAFRIYSDKQDPKNDGQLQGLYLLVNKWSHLMCPPTLPVCGNLAMSSDGSPVLKVFVAVRARVTDAVDADWKTDFQGGEPRKTYYDHDGRNDESPLYLPLFGNKEGYRHEVTEELSKLLY